MKRLTLALLLAFLPVAAMAQDVINPQTDASKLTTGALPAGRLPALTGDITSSAGSAATTLATGSASNLNSGTLAAARGGAGTISGALKGNGAGLVTQAACADLSNGTAYCSATTGQLPGIAAATAATAGNIGEYISSNVPFGSAVALVTLTAKDVTTVTLTAGDWLCNGNVGFVAGGTTTSTQHVSWISLTPNTTPTVPNGGAYSQSSASYSAAQVPVLPTGAFRVLTTGAPVSLGASSNFAVSTMSAYGFLGCLRTH